MLAPWRKSYDQPRQHIKKQRHYLANKCWSSQSYGFSSSQVCMWELNYKESWALKNWCFWTVVLEKTLESPLDCKEIQCVHPKGNQSWVFIGSLRGVYNFLGSVSPQQKFKATDGPVLQLSFIWQAKENTSSRCEGGWTQKTWGEERPTAQFWLLLLYVFSPPSEPALCKLNYPGVLFVLPEVLSMALGPSFVLFLWRAFPFLSFSLHYSGLLFPSLTT